MSLSLMVLDLPGSGGCGFFSSVEVSGEPFSICLEETGRDRQTDREIGAGQGGGVVGGWGVSRI